MTPDGTRLIPTLYQRGSKNGSKPPRWNAPNNLTMNDKRRPERRPLHVTIRRLSRGWFLFRQQEPDAARCDLAVPVHPQFVSDFGARHQRRGIALMQTRNMEEDVLASAIRPQKAKALLFEVGHDGTRLGVRRAFFSGFAGSRGTVLRPSTLVADALFQKGHILVGKSTNGLARFRRHLQVQIFLQRFFKEAFLSGVQTSNPF